MIDHRTLTHGQLIERDALTDELAAEIRTKLWLKENVIPALPEPSDPSLTQLRAISLEHATLL